MTKQITTADEIITCARSLIASGGYNGFSYADIADIIGIRKASIHHHFPTKADLVQTLISRYRIEAEAGIANLESEIADPVEQLRAYIGYWNSCVTETTSPMCLCALLASQIPMLPPEVASEVQAHFKMFSQWLASVLKRGVQQGKIRPSASIEAEGEAFLATVHGAMLSARASGNPETFKLITTTLLNHLTITA